MRIICVLIWLQFTLSWRHDSMSILLIDFILLTKYVNIDWCLRFFSGLCCADPYGSRIALSLLSDQSTAQSLCVPSGLATWWCQHTAGLCACRHSMRPDWWVSLSLININNITQHNNNNNNNYSTTIIAAHNTTQHSNNTTRQHDMPQRNITMHKTTQDNHTNCQHTSQ